MGAVASCPSGYLGFRPPIVIYGAIIGWPKVSVVPAWQGNESMTEEEEEVHFNMKNTGTSETGKENQACEWRNNVEVWSKEFFDKIF